MTSMKLTYFNVKWLAEPLRLAMTLGGIEFEDERLTGEEFAERKKTGEFPYGQVPILTIDGVVYAQSNAMLRYIGKRTGLYPECPVKAMQVDGVMDTIQDASAAMSMDATEAGRKVYVEEKIPQFFAPIDNMIKANGGPFLMGEQITIADLRLYVIVRMLSAGGVYLEHIPATCLDQFESILSLANAVGDNEKIAAWEKSHE